ncbi:M20/M25/M40 family metallo-hydrolase [Flammeovirga pectinis]|uniref:M20/M25/M40 family metallo-hydrolase n=1 Tax=Flammeovirga pectinis TaxID=2494373 RepID=A0A3Q9FPL7_9BACT|nr:M20/M25/M40 family metallo-hydrolase [Flammeovirga pectinis]AZQ63458.1 M20/M25/M40 family metallo-hydrolase [Flammeovirga pectinis]
MKAVEKNIKTLSAKNMRGRGYTFNGDKKAAAFIEQKFKDIGLQSYPKEEYLQHFEMPVNTFPNNITLKINANSLKVGVDYLPSTDSGTGNAEGEAYYISSDVFIKDAALVEFLKVDLSNKIVIYDQEEEKNRITWNRALTTKILQARASIVLFDKLTFSVARWQVPQPRFYVLREKLPADIEKISFSIQPKFFKEYTSQNVISYIKGKTHPDKYLVFTAHYDHLGSIGKQIYFPGANDNASGIALLLEIAKYYKSNTPDYSIVFIAFGAEEAGLIGSRYYVEHPFFPLDKIDFLINLDLFGSGEEGMMAVNGAVFTEQYQLLTSINTKNEFLPEIKKRGKAANSDHYYFSENGVPCFFFYLMGASWPHYHDIKDNQPLPLSGFKGAYKLITTFGNELQTSSK